MKNNKYIIAFILGILSSMLFIPLIEELANILLTWMEYFKILPSKLVLKGNKELSELQNSEDEKQDTYAIGFQYNPEENEYEYYEGEE